MSARGPDADAELASNTDPMRSTLAGTSSESSGVRRLELDDTNTQLGGYRLERRLGAGGMGEVFAARKPGSGETVALKILSTTTATRLYRFKREFRALADVEHPNLIRLHELVVPKVGAAFFAMEYIDGRPFVDWVREGIAGTDPPDVEHLLGALRQLVDGVLALHERGYVHRDLKPANVLVTPAGRVVILDFGLVSDTDSVDPGITREGLVLGTPSYMAPEQTLAGRAGPEADIYALGVMLFECLTGELPHRGSAAEIMLAKQRKHAPDPGTITPTLPDWLRSLCVHLLAREPDRRPRGQELLASLALTPAPKLRPAELFVGRETELHTLHAALAEVRDRAEPLVVQLRGRSGLGKSALVRQFRAQLGDTEVTVLHGRCGHNELLPYKGVDAVIDSLSAILRSESPDSLSALRPPELGALVEMFPVLDELWSHSSSAKTYGLDELRRRGTEALRELLVGLGRRSPIIIHIDDLQWADLDSVGLLETLTRAPGAPRMLLILAYRAESGDAEPIRAINDDPSSSLSSKPEYRIELEGLSDAEARELATKMGPLEAPDLASNVATIALRSRGSPFFIVQTMLRGAGVTSDEDSGEAAVDGLVASRLDALDAGVRELLERIAVFRGPAPVDVILELCPTAPSDAIEALCDQGLLVHESGLVDVAHDRVRAVALTAIPEHTRLREHWRIGLRLRERLDEGDETWLFATVNHLDAGLADADTLEPAPRLRLAQLHLRAGTRALRSTAWSTARRYFDSGSQLIAPWLDEARRGEGPYELCVGLTFGRCQVEQLLESDDAPTAFEELLSWSLTTPDFCRIAQWYCELLFVRARFEATTRFAGAALARLGIPMPAQPSWPRAVTVFFRGWRKLGATELETLVGRPQTRAIESRTAMELAAMASGSAGFVDPRMLFVVMGRYCELLTEHGPHDWIGVSLSGLALAAMAIGQPAKALELMNEAWRCAERHAKTAASYSLSVTVYGFVAPSLIPLPEVSEHLARAHERVLGSGQRMLLEPLVIIRLSVLLHHGVEISRLDELLAPYRNPSSCAFAHSGEQFVEFGHWLRALREGETSLDIDAPLGSHLHDGQRGFLLVLRAKIATLLANYAGATRVLDQLSPDMLDALAPVWWIRSYIELLRVISLTEHHRGASSREQRQALRAARKHRAQLATWSKLCPTNYATQLEIVDAEIARMKGRFEEASKAYERARVLADTNAVMWLRGLASERMTTLAETHGHALLAKAAREAACEAYEAWGAVGISRRLRA